MSETIDPNAVQVQVDGQPTVVAENQPNVPVPVDDIPVFYMSRSLVMTWLAENHMIAWVFLVLAVVAYFFGFFKSLKRLYWQFHDRIKYPNPLAKLGAADSSNVHRTV